MQKDVKGFVIYATCDFIYCFCKCWFSAVIQILWNQRCIL